jgi:hypothetical protein
VPRQIAVVGGAQLAGDALDLHAVSTAELQGRMSWEPADRSERIPSLCTILLFGMTGQAA